ncbi:MAG: hypothetical protein ABI024_16870, partial [Vicinamibacterales bacterium]
MTPRHQAVGGRVRLALRIVAIAIAIAGVIDPAFSTSRPPSQKLIAIRMTSSPAVAVEQALRANLPDWEVEPREWHPHLPCSPDEQCVVIADGSRDASLPRDLSKPLSLVTVAPGDGPNVMLRSVSASRGHQSAGGVARVELAGIGLDEAMKSEVRVLDGGAVIGTATGAWSGAATLTIDVPWWPIDTGARVLRIEVLPFKGEQTLIDNHVDIGVDVGTTRSPVLVFDARPSWASTFVRRAIEDDPRFAVGYRTRLAPALSAGTANGRLDVATLDQASTVVIGGGDALTSGDVVLLEQFVRARGGTLVLLPERAPAGPWSRLLPGTWTEHLSAKPEKVGALHASEVLRTDRLPITATVIAASGSSASIVVLPIGGGRMVISGAMDAWRYRDLDAGQFDQFWRSLIAEGAASGEGLQLTFDNQLSARGARARFTLRDRRMAPTASTEASAIARCGSAPATVIRMWPAGGQAEFIGELPLSSNRSCSIEAVINDRQVTGSIAVAETPAFGVEQTLAKLERRVMASGGAVTRAGDEALVARALAAAPRS